MLGDDVACQLSYTEYDVVAKGYGGEGYSVRDIRNVKKVRGILFLFSHSLTHHEEYNISITGTGESHENSQREEDTRMCERADRKHGLS